ncbi:MAG: shikimate kinase [Alistipes sp.]|nr:shikimate kinase [Alistipes sp.]
MKIFLVGYMGCGKSSLGRKLAKACNAPFYDMDSIIEQREGATISDIFHFAGEQYFRDKERELIEELGAMQGDMIISTGGGAPAWSDNMERMNALGEAVYLRRTAKQIASRLSPRGRYKRPKLRGLNDEELVAFMTANMAEREPFYLRAAHCVECAELSDEAIIDVILDLIKKNEQ